MTSFKIEGLPDGINPSKPPRNYKEARMRPDAAQWMDVYAKEYQGIMDRKAVDMVKPPPGAKILGTTTRLEYKIDNGKLSKWKARMCVRGDQQVEGGDYFQQDLYAPTLNTTEARLIAAIVAQYGAKLIKTDCKQAFVYGDMNDGPPIYIKVPDWWPEPVPDGYALLLRKSIYGTKQAARKWHQRMSG